MDIPTFRSDFPQFATTPDTVIQRYLDLAAKFVTTKRWDASIIDYGQELWTAHHIALGNADSTGQVKGPATSKSVDTVSVSYDTQAVALQGGGHWNMTTYGIQFLQLARMVGAGPVQL